MKIAVINTMSPFIRGGAEVLAERLVKELQLAGNSADLIRVPLDSRSPAGILKSMFTFSNLQIPNVDLVIPLRFPAYYAMQHDGKHIVWLMHQFRQVYDLWDSPLGFRASEENRSLKEIITNSDQNCFLKSDRLFCNSEVTADRLMEFNSMQSEVLLAPPLSDVREAFEVNYDPYVLCIGRVSSGKRQLEAVKAMKHTRTKIELVVAGHPESHEYHSQILKAISELDNPDRVKYVPEFIAEETKFNYLDHCAAVLYSPVDEDSYGYVTLEAAFHRKAVITALDSGGTHMLVQDDITGSIIDHSPKQLAKTFDDVFLNRDQWKEYGNMHFKVAKSFGLSWDTAIRKLVQE